MHWFQEVDRGGSWFPQGKNKASLLWRAICENAEGDKMLAGRHGIWPVVLAVGISHSAVMYHWPAVEKQIKNTRTMISAGDLSKYAKEKKTKQKKPVTDNRRARHPITML